MTLSLQSCIRKCYSLKLCKNKLYAYIFSLEQVQLLNLLGALVHPFMQVTEPSVTQLQFCLSHLLLLLHLQSSQQTNSSCLFSHTQTQESTEGLQQHIVFSDAVWMQVVDPLKTQAHPSLLQVLLVSHLQSSQQTNFLLLYSHKQMLELALLKRTHVFLAVSAISITDSFGTQVQDFFSHVLL